MDYSTEVTETILRSMPAEDYMGPSQCAFFRTRLQAMLADAEVRIASPLDIVNEAPIATPDENDRASLFEQQQMAHKERERLVFLQREILAALHRIEGGEYGFCEESGDEIGIERLLAMPTARYCLEVQSSHERRDRMAR